MLPLHCEQLQSLHISSVQEVQPWVHPAALPLFSSPPYAPAAVSPASSRGLGAVRLAPPALQLAQSAETAHAVIEIRPEALLSSLSGDAASSSVVHGPPAVAPPTASPGGPSAAPITASHTPVRTPAEALLLPAPSTQPARHLQRQDAFRVHSSDTMPPIRRLHSISSARHSTSFHSSGAAVAAAAAAVLGPYGGEDAASSSRRSSSSSSASLSSSGSGGVVSGFSRLIAALRLGGMARLAEHLAGLRDVPSEGATAGSGRGFGSTSSRRARRSRLRAEAFLELETYDDLLALDQFNVKRGVKLAAVQQLPARMAGSRHGAALHKAAAVTAAAAGTAVPGASEAAVATPATVQGAGRHPSSSSSGGGNNMMLVAGLHVCACAVAGCTGCGAQGSGQAGVARGGAVAMISSSSSSSRTGTVQRQVHSSHHRDAHPLRDQQQHLHLHHRHPQQPQHEEGEERCHICMEQYVCMAGTKAVVTLPCGHEYCRSCIWGWLKDHVTCPVCRWRFPDSDTHLLT